MIGGESTIQAATSGDSCASAVEAASCLSTDRVDWSCYVTGRRPTAGDNVRRPSTDFHHHVPAATLSCRYINDNQQRASVR